MRRGQGQVWRFTAAVCALALLPSGALAQDAELERGLEGVETERERVEREIDELREAEGDARARLEVLESELGEAEVALTALQGQLEEAMHARQSAQDAATAARSELQAVLAEQEATEALLAEKRGQLEARVVAAFKHGQISFAEMFTGAKDFSDLVSSSTFVASVMEGDRVLVDEASELFATVEEQRAAAQQLRRDAEREAATATAAEARIAQATDEQERMLASIAEQHEEREQLFEELKEDRAAAEGHLAGLEQESARIEDQLAAIAREQAAARAAAEAEARRRAAAQAAAGGQGGGDAVEDGPGASITWIRPVAGPVTSMFGPRWGRNHNGVDLAGGVGTTVIAAASGTVVHVTASCHPTSSWGCGGGFGNYVTVAHADGMATIYAHLSTVSIGAGQQVDAGTTIGGVGNSGNSYGPHLHLEVRDAGIPREPCGYIPC
ncbi:MAG: peptidoglycan DD-metalloendopeptidase family protein [Nitriliruptoraceae bacterium]